MQQRIRQGQMNRRDREIRIWKYRRRGNERTRITREYQADL